MDNDKKSIINQTFIEAIKNHKNKNLEVAKDFYNKILKIDPHYIGAINSLGKIHKELGDTQKAKFFFEKAIEIDANHTDTLNNLGIISKELGDTQKAKIFFEKVIEIDPNFKTAFNNLGLVFKELGDTQEAINYYKKAIEIDPNFKTALNNLGLVFKELGDTQEAINCYKKLIEMDPNNISLINGLSDLLETFKLSYKIKVEKINFKQLFLFLFRKNNINHSNLVKNAKLFLFFDNKQHQYADLILEIINSESRLLENKRIKSLLKQELFHLMLQKSLIVDEFFEKLLTKLRCEILFTIGEPNQNILKEYSDSINSLAEQCWLNEYLYTQSEKEIKLIDKLKDKIENDKNMNELEVAILGCYIPLNSSKIIIDKLVNYKSSNILFNDLINVQIKEPLREIELKKSIKSLDVINDPTSMKVRDQYEENPYPRWRYTNVSIPNNFFRWINTEILPNITKQNNNFDKPNVLIAGCGTGNHSISAMRYKNSNILGVDLSLASLAYAKRKSEELNIENIEFIQADILQLKKLNKKFDIIESAGAIQTMQDPIAGLKVLLDILEPHGFLRLGLYSEIARQPVVEIREFIKDKDKDIRSLRELIINEKKDQIFRNSRDFYSTSSIRDLLFHVKEHRFTIPEILEILKNLNLEFLGFNFEDPKIKINFSKSFPNDKNNISLDNWNQFEINNPYTFATMYQFWVRKNF